jgi:type IV secretory pathway TraG/TraD family ATPase VirD4
MKDLQNSYQGFEVIKHRVIMTGKMYFTIVVMCVAFQVVSLIAALFHFIPVWDLELLWKWPVAQLLATSPLNPTFHFHMPQGVVSITAKELVTNFKYTDLFNDVDAPWGKAFALSFLAWGFLPLSLRFFSRATTQIKDDEHIRGAQLITEAEIKNKSDGTGILPMGSFKISEELSRRHLLIAGQTGSGKSSVLIHHLDAIQKSRRRALANDFKGELVERFYRPQQDLILNPLDSRGLGWTLFNELNTKPDLSAIAGSLIPPSKGEDRFWSAAAQGVFIGIMADCYNSGNRTNAALWRAITSPIKKIADMCQATASGQAGYSYIQDASSKQAAGVIAVLMSYVSWLEYASDGPFSLRQWANSQTDHVTYITSLEEVSNTMRPYLSLFADLAGKRLLALPENNSIDNSIYLVLDELGNMQRLPSVKRLLTAGRSKGVIVEIGVQELAGVESIYGRDDTRTIINNCGSKMIMNLGDPDAAKFFSDMCSDEEYWQSSTTYSISQDDQKGGENHSRQIKSRKVVMPAEIMRLPVGRGYFMLPGGNPALIDVPWTEANERPVVNKPFILRNGLSLDDVEAREYEITARAVDVKESPVPDELKNKVLENVTRRAREEKEDEEALEQGASPTQINLSFDLTL